jgi:predicted acetyltransferase
VEHEIRPLTPDDVRPFLRAEHIPFGIVIEDKDLDWASPLVEPDRSFSVVDGGRIVGTAGANSFELTLPGGASIPVAGVTMVGVLPTHRRRGILAAMMRHQLDDVHRRGEAVAVLTASEYVIYRRYGYGPASYGQSFELQTSRAAFATDVEDAGRLALLDADAAAKILPALHERIRRRRPGDISRRPVDWDLRFLDPEVLRGGASRRFIVLHESASGEPDGFLTYRINRSAADGAAGNRLIVDELMALDDAVVAALWRFALDVDLVAIVAARHRAMDDVLPLRLLDRRRLRLTEVADLLWCRLVDVAAALRARRYATTGELVLEVSDEFCPWNTGTYVVEAGPDGARCERVDGGRREADVFFEAGELGAVYLGGTRFADLARAGRIEERVAGAAAAADAMFAAERAPWLTSNF